MPWPRRGEVCLVQHAKEKVALTGRREANQQPPIKPVP